MGGEGEGRGGEGRGRRGEGRGFSPHSEGDSSPLGVATIPDQLQL